MLSSSRQSIGRRTTALMRVQEVTPVRPSHCPRNGYHANTTATINSSTSRRFQSASHPSTAKGPSRIQHHHHRHHRYHHHYYYYCNVRTMSGLILPPNKNNEKQQTFGEQGNILPTAEKKSNDNNDDRKGRLTAKKDKRNVSGSKSSGSSSRGRRRDSSKNKKPIKEKKSTQRGRLQVNDTTNSQELKKKENESKNADDKTRTKKSSNKIAETNGNAKNKGLSPDKIQKNSSRNDKSIEKLLQQWYEDNHGVEFRDKCITLKKVRKKESYRDFTMWTAQFVCPITGTVFDSAILKSSPKEAYKEVDGQICYFKMAKARTAALARALDYFRSKDRDDFPADDLFCEESTSGSSDAASALSGNDGTVGADATDTLESDNGSGLSAQGLELLSLESDGDDDDEEYILQYLPGTGPNDDGSLEGVNPMARVIGAWSETPASLRYKTDSSTSILVFHPEQELQKLLRNAQDWIKQQEPERDDAGNQHRVMLHGIDSPRTLEIGKSILSGLAKSHRQVKFQSKPRGVEETATKILNHLWSTSSAQPDADVYAAYISCLEGSDAVTIAQRAKMILDEMDKESIVGVARGRTMPKPNVRVVNAVVEACAHVGGESGRYDLDSIERPNRYTYLSLLSSMNYPASVDGETNGFDPIFAQECLDRLDELARENPADTSLKVDTQLYNAGLRWAGGLQSTISRPYMRPLPWDKYGDLFRHGFQPFDEESDEFQDAYRMNSWLEEMSSLENGIQPNIETYESVIQAYVRTGSLEGVRQAEQLLESILDSATYRSCLRMQSFHPVIAAWAYSGHETSPEQVGKWISRLENLAEEAGDLRLDCRVHEAMFLANSSKVLKNLEEVDSSGDDQHFLDIAYGCSEHLRELCSKHRQDQEEDDQDRPALIDANVFALVINLWGKLGNYLLGTKGKLAEGDVAISKMREVVAEFEDLILALRRSESSDSNRDLQLHHLIRNAYKLYGIVLSNIQELEKVNRIRDAAGSECPARGLEGHLHDMERWVRRVHEFSQVDRPDDDIHRGYYYDSGYENNMRQMHRELLYEDMFSYTSDAIAETVCAENEADFSMQVLKSLKKDFPIVSRRRGDLIRLCFKTLDLLPLNIEKSELTDVYKQAVETICQLATGPGEQEALLMRILEKVENLNAEEHSSVGDHDAIIQEIRKHSNLPKSSTGRPSPRQRRKGPQRPGNTGQSSNAATTDMRVLIETEA